MLDTFFGSPEWGKSLTKGQDYSDLKPISKRCGAACWNGPGPTAAGFWTCLGGALIKNTPVSSLLSDLGWAECEGPERRGHILEGRVCIHERKASGK